MAPSETDVAFGTATGRRGDREGARPARGGFAVTFARYSRHGSSAGVATGALRGVAGAAAIGSAALPLVGMAITVVGLVALRHPNVGPSDEFINDAMALATGHFLYGNPGTHVVGLPTTPVYTGLVAGLLKLYWWEGWGPLVSVLAVLGAIVALVTLAWSTFRGRRGRVLVAAAITSLSVGSLSMFSPNGLFEARPDQLAWALAVVAGSIIFRALLGSGRLTSRQQVVVGLLLTASVFTKQSTLVPAVVLSLVPCASALALEARGRSSWWPLLRGAALCPLVFVASSVLCFALLQALSHGFAWGLLVADGLRIAHNRPFGLQLAKTIGILAIPVAVVVGLGIVVAVSKRRGARRNTLVLVACAVVVSVSAIPSAVLINTKIGGGNNELVGPVWMATLAVTVLLVVLGPWLRQVAATVIACGVLLAGVGPVASALRDAQVGAPVLFPHASWSATDPYLYAFVDRGRPVSAWYDPSLSVVDGTSGAPSGDWIDAFVSGYTPRYYIADLLRGSYALVYPFPVKPHNLAYVSDEGRYDGSVYWKLNLLLSEGYAPVRDPRNGLILDKPTARLAGLGWFAGCFGPWQADGSGIEVRLRGTGGLLCLQGGALDLSRAPKPRTDVVLSVRPGARVVTVGFDDDPTSFRVTPLSAADVIAGSGSDVAHRGSAVARCLAVHGGAGELDIRASATRRRIRCVGTSGSRVLEVPVEPGASTAHVLLQVSAADDLSIGATGQNGAAAPFTTFDPGPGSAGGL